jgi:hypothetical protein
MVNTAVLALDQSSSHVGWASFLNGKLESWGTLIPDPPNYNLLRAWVKDFIGQFRHEGYTVDVLCENVYFNKTNPHTFEVLCICRGHLHAATMDMNAGWTIVNSQHALSVFTGLPASTRREDRKKAIMMKASEITGERPNEHESDAIAIGFAFLHDKQKGR